MTPSSQASRTHGPRPRRRYGDLVVLAHREFRLLFIGQTASLLGDGMAALALSFAVLDLTGSTTDLGLVLAARSVPLVGLLLLGGALADRFSRRLVMLCADAVRCGVQAVLAVLLISHSAQLWQLLILAAIPGAASAFFNPASTGLIASVVDSDQRQAANALRSIAIAATNITGPLLAGILVAASSPGWAIAADSLSFAISAFSLSQLQLPPPITPPDQTIAARLRGGLDAVRSRRWIAPVILGLSLVNMFFGWFLVLGVVIARRSLGGAHAWSLILAGFAAGSVLGGTAALRLRPRHPLLTGLSALGLAGGLPPLSLALSAPLPLDITTAALAGITIMLFNASWETCLQQHVPSELLSRVSAYDWLGSAALNPIGYAIAGPAATLLTVKTSLLIAAIAIAISCLTPLLSTSVRTLPPTPNESSH